ncbi:ABC-2 family transporter protein [Candidatus Woesearchaeota archaeon]|nr:ABC-2 family transporter protein [Candidatus Woesearchaeota archaeon]
MNLRGDWSLAKAGIKIWSTYRFEFLIHLITTPLSLVIYYYLWKSIYAYMGTDIVRGFTFNDMISYYVLSMIVGFFTWSEVDKWLEHDLIRGFTIKGLLKPISFLSWYMSFEIGINIMNVITQMIPIFIIGVIFFQLKTAAAFNIITFIISILCAFFIYFGLTYLLGLTAFWLKRISGIRRVRRAVFGFFAGSFLPLTLFPQWAQNVFHYLPFENMKFVPITIYLGMMTKTEIIKALAIQIIWIAIIFTAAHFVWKQAYKRFSSVGL